MNETFVFLALYSLMCISPFELNSTIHQRMGYVFAYLIFVHLITSLLYIALPNILYIKSRLRMKFAQPVVKVKVSVNPTTMAIDEPKKDLEALEAVILSDSYSKSVCASQVSACDRMQSHTNMSNSIPNKQTNIKRSHKNAKIGIAILEDIVRDEENSPSQVYNDMSACKYNSSSAKCLRNRERSEPLNLDLLIDELEIRSREDDIQLGEKGWDEESP